MLKGSRHSAETKARQSVSASRRVRAPHSSETRAKIAAAHQGLRHSAETLVKLRASHIGIAQSPESRAKQSAARTGEKHWNWQGGISAARNVRRTATKRRNGGHHTEREWREKIELHAGCCIYCGEQKPLTRDHNIPLSRGGTDDIGNILPACLSCNSRKQTRTAQEFFARKAA
jgi:5-methylcytosine-specific restriction endonuclease McrA